jgi:hypothetical protein
MRCVASDGELDELLERTLDVIERQTGAGAGVVLIPVQIPGGTTVLAARARAKDDIERLKMIQVGIEALTSEFTRLYTLVLGEEPETNALGVGATPPPDVFAAGMAAMDILRERAHGILLVVHAKELDADGNQTGGTFAAMNKDTSQPDEFRALADLAPQLVEKWSQQAKETLAGLQVKEPSNN